MPHYDSNSNIIPSLAKINSDAKNKGIMSRLTSPLQDEFRIGDVVRLQGLFPIIPFMDCGDATLKIIRQLSELSPTQAACINSKMGYSLSGGLGLRRRDDVLKRQNNKEQPISDAEHNRYHDFLRTNINLRTLAKKINKAGRNYATYGNMVVEVVLSQIGRIRGASINVYDADMFRLRLPKSAGFQPNQAYKGEGVQPAINLSQLGIQTAFISERWDFDFVSRNAHRVVEYPVYSPQKFDEQPIFAPYTDGTYRCLIHITDDAIDRQYYGLPSAISGIYYQFMEFQCGKYATRGYENQWLPAFFMEIEEVPQIMDGKDNNDVIKEFVQYSRNVFTNSSDEQKIPGLIRTRAPEATPATVVQFDTRPDKGFHPEMAKLASDEILKANQWHSSLIEKRVGSIGNNSEFGDLARITDATVIRPLQENILLPFRIAITTIEDWIGYNNAEDLEIDLKSVFETDVAMSAQAAAPAPAPIAP